MANANFQLLSISTTRSSKREKDIFDNPVTPIRKDRLGPAFMSETLVCSILGAVNVLISVLKVVQFEEEGAWQ